MHYADFPKSLREMMDNLPGELDQAERAAYLSQVLIKNKKQKHLALQLARFALHHNPDSAVVKRKLGWFLKGSVPPWHFPMINDTERSAAYAVALAAQVQPGMTVLEIGTGSGLLAMLAARAGAAHVYSFEAMEPIAVMARRIIAHNGLADRITVINKFSTQGQVGSDLPDKADLLVAEIISNNLLSEQVLASVAHAKQHLLHANAPLLPSQLGIDGVLVGGDYAQQYRIDQPIEGFDLSEFNHFVPTQAVARLWPDAAAQLSARTNLFRFHLHDEQMQRPATAKVPFEATGNGEVSALLQTTWVEFDDGTRLDNHLRVTSGWDPMIYTFSPPRPVQPGDRLHLKASHDSRQVYVSLLAD